MRFLTALIILFFITTNVYSGEVYDPAKHGGCINFLNKYKQTPTYSKKKNLNINNTPGKDVVTKDGGKKKKI